MRSMTNILPIITEIFYRYRFERPMYSVSRQGSVRPSGVSALRDRAEAGKVLLLRFRGGRGA